MSSNKAAVVALSAVALASLAVIALRKRSKPQGSDYSCSLARTSMAQTSQTAVKQSVLTVEEKYHLITRNLQEVIGGEELKHVLAQRDLKVYWGTATTGAPHIGYFVPMSKIADFLSAGCEVTILFADLHAYLDNMKSSWELLKHRTAYYEAVIKAMLRSIGVPLDKLKFVLGTDFQLSKEYTLDVYRYSSIVTTKMAQKAGAEVVKQVDNPLLSGLLYPILQALDEQYLGVDAQFGGVDQRKIFMFAETFMPKIGYKKRIHLMNPMVPGLQGPKMSSSDKNSKIDLLDPADAVQKKIKVAFCEEGNIEHNGILSFAKMVLFALLKGQPFVVARKAQNGGDVSYSTFAEMEEAFKNKLLHPGDLKAAVFDKLNRLLEPIRSEFQSADRKQMIALAYPKVEESGKQETVVEADIFGDDEKQPIVPDEPVATTSAPGTKDASLLDLRVAEIVAVAKHESKDHLYVVSVSTGPNPVKKEESTILTVVAGLAKKLTESQLLHRRVIVISNLKPSKFAGVLSQGMILAACTEEKDGPVEVLDAPAAAVLGERVAFAGVPPQAPQPIIDLDKDKKLLPELLSKFVVDSTGTAVLKLGSKVVPFMTTAGVVTAATLKDAMVR